MIEIDEKEVLWVRDRWFDKTNGKLKPGDAAYDELHRRFVALKATLDDLPEWRQGKVYSVIMSTLSSSQFEAAVEYMMRNTPADELLMIYDRIVQAHLKGSKYGVDYPGILQFARNRLRDGAFDWNFRYLENCTESVYLEAALRLARESGLSVPDDL